VRQEKQKEFGFEIVEQAQQVAEIDLVVPFTTPELTKSALAATDRMGNGLHVRLRVVKVQVVPFPMELDQSPVYIEFLKEQLRKFKSALPMSAEIRLAREFQTGLSQTLRPESVVILATRRRLWRTRNESLAASLRRAGHKVVLVYSEGDNA
jgi:hypothetical protein